MRKVWTKLLRLGVTLGLLAALFDPAAIAGSQTTSSDSQATSANAKSKNATGSSSPAAEAEIAAAKASGKVWVNLDSGVYHKGGRWFGKTKNGKFMTADEAQKAGYKAAKRD